MMYRPESYLQFIIKNNLPPVFRFTLPVALIAMLVLSYFTSYETNPKGFWGTVIFVSVCGTIMFLFITSVTYKIYSKGNIAYERLSITNEEILVIEDVDISISNFDLYSSQDKSPFALFSQTLYDFRKADIILSDFSLIVLGKSNFSGSMQFALPVEITNSLGKTGMPVANIQSFQKQSDKLTLKIMDRNFKKPIKLIFRSNLDDIVNWYIRYQTKAVSSHYDYK